MMPTFKKQTKKHKNKKRIISKICLTIRTKKYFDISKKKLKGPGGRVVSIVAWQSSETAILC